MKALTKILVPVDLSENSVHIVQQAIDIANRCRAQIFLLHIYNRPLLKIRGKKLFEKNILHTLEREMLYWKERRIRSRFRSLLKRTPKADDIKFTIIKERGLLVEKIREVVKRYRIDLVIAGTDHYNKKAGLWNHKVAGLSKRINIPFLLLPYRSEMAEPAKVAFAYDLKNIANLEKLNIVKIFSSLYNAEIHIFTVKQDLPLSEEEQHNLEALKDYFSGYAPVVHMVTDSDVERGILRYLNKYQISLVTLLHRSRNFFEKILHKSVSRRMALDSDVPVLTLEEH